MTHTRERDRLRAEKRARFMQRLKPRPTLFRVAPKKKSNFVEAARQKKLDDVAQYEAARKKKLNTLAVGGIEPRNISPVLEPVGENTRIFERGGKE